MKEPDLEEERLTAEADGLKISLDRVTMEDTVEPVTMLSPDGSSDTVTLEEASSGSWRARVDVTSPGLYKFETRAPTGALTAVAIAGVSDPREMSEVTATRTNLLPLVEQTGGDAYWTRTSATSAVTDVTVPRVTLLSGARTFSGSSWLALKDRQAFVTNGVTLTPMFNGLIALAALLFLMTLAWWREGR